MLRNFLTRFLRDRRGNVTILAGGGLMMLLGATALGVDVGSIYLEMRRLQGIADLAALSAAGAAGTGEAQARATIAANPGGNASLARIEPGRYTADVNVDAAQRFQPGGASPNAVRVTLAEDVPLFFGQILTGQRTARVTVKATASRSNMAAFSIGSRLAAVGGGLPGALLSALVGSELNLTAMDYNALAGADIDLLAFSDALRTTARLNAVTFADTLRANVTLPQILEAMAVASGPSQTRATLRALALRVPTTSVRLDALIDPGPLAGRSRADPANRVSVDSYAMLRELLVLANGNRQLSLDLGVALPGLASTTLRVAIGERPANSPWLAISADNIVVVRTAQTRLYLDARLGGAATLGLISLRLPIFIELAQAEASLSSVNCGLASRSVSLRVTPAVGQISIADVEPAAFDNFKAPLTLQPAIIARALVAQISGQATVHLGGVTPQTVTFSADDIASGRTRTVSTGDLTQGIAASLIGSLDLRVTALGLGLNVGALLAPVGSALGGIAPALDGVLDQVTGLLGVHVGQADVRVNGLRCGTSVLVG